MAHLALSGAGKNAVVQSVAMDICAERLTLKGAA